MEIKVYFIYKEYSIMKETKHQYADYAFFFNVEEHGSEHTKGSLIGRICDEPVFQRITFTTVHHQKISNVPVLSFSIASHFVSKSLCSGLQITPNRYMQSKDGTSFIRIHIWNRKIIKYLYENPLVKGDQLVLGGTLKYQALANSGSTNYKRYVGSALTKMMTSPFTINFFEMNVDKYSITWHKSWSLKQNKKD